MPRKGYKQTEEHKIKAKEARTVPSGRNHMWWKGGRFDNGEGRIYIWSPNHPHRERRGYVLESRLVMEKEIGRYLLPNEVVHHKNKDLGDNRIENLVLFSSHSEHIKHEHKNGAYDNRGDEWKRKLSQAHKLAHLNRKRDSFGRFI